MIPRQSRNISFCNEFIQILQKVPIEEITPLILIVSNIVVTITLIFFNVYDYQANHILLSNKIDNKTQLYGKYGYDQ
ncbi:15034_t:CDS:2 [Dentiscutata erythropus]|uniref:15034_t:CDS:1 n=1 Tax=Dentiscutata erythropus TaxID=1348616 RepID=A0A9N9IHT8_9GLOM|nr:15034_t:CDS:2 [Dentiscutata erythropus]